MSRWGVEEASIIGLGAYQGTSRAPHSSTQPLQTQALRSRALSPQPTQGPAPLSLPFLRILTS